MSGPKTKINEQFGRVSLTGTTPGNVSSDDDGREPLLDENGRIWVRDIGGGVIPVFPTRNQIPLAASGGAGGVNFALGPGFLTSLTGFIESNVNPFPLFLQIFDSSIPPVVPLISIPLLALNTAFSYSAGFQFAVGLTVALSTTPTALTFAAGDVFVTQGVFLS